jgi:hypothetical protein
LIYRNPTTAQIMENRFASATGSSTRIERGSDLCTGLAYLAQRQLQHPSMGAMCSARRPPRVAIVQKEQLIAENSGSRSF